MSDIESLSVRIGVEDDGVDDQVSRIGDIIEYQFAERMANSIADAGRSLEDFAQKQAPLTVQTQGLARVLGMQEGEVRDLAASLTDVTRPLDQVLDTMELGRQQGLKSVDQLSDYVLAWDTVGDATGENAQELAKGGAALRAFGIDAGNTRDAFPAFGFILEETTLGVGEFQKMLGKVAPDLEGMNLSVSDAAAVVGIMERDFGITGRALNREFGSAVRDADGDVDALLENLGISAERFAEMSGVVDESSDAIQANADEFGKSFTPMQRIQAELDKLMYQYGSFAEVAGMIAPIMMAAAPAMKLAALAKMQLNLAFLASPITWIILAVVALVAAIVLLVIHFDTVRAAVGKAFDWMWQKTSGYRSWFIRTFWESGLKPVVDGIVAGAQWIGDAFASGWQWAQDTAADAVSLITGIPERIRNAFWGLADTISAPFRWGFSQIAGFWNRTVGQLSWSVPSWVPGVGGNSVSAPQLPTFHDGGIVGGTGEQLILAEGGEGVFTPEQMRALGAARRGGDGASMPTEFEATARIDLGEGIERAVTLKFERRDRALRRRVTAGSGAVR